MKEPRSPFREFVSSQRRKLLALAAGAALAGAAVEHNTKPAEAKIVEAAPDPRTPHEARMDALRALDEGRMIETKEQIDARFAVIDPLINLAYHKDNSKEMIIQVDRYLGVLLFDPLTEKDAAYASMTLAEVGEATRETIVRGRVRKECDEARRILKGRLHEELIETIRRMDSEQVVERRVFLGLTVHGPKSASYDQIGDAWTEKMTKKSTTSEKVRRYAPSTREQLRGKEGRLTLASWVERQQRAIDLFAAHAEELGYKRELIEQITPETMLGVIHAELFPDLDAETFVRLSPVLFETYNIAFAPAMGDMRFSGGLAQMTAETFEGILKKHRGELERIRDTDDRAAILVPSEGSRGEFSAAMLTDEDSQFFYNVFVIAENTRLATRGVAKDKRFVAAWGAADEDERAQYMGTLISMANNLPSAAKYSAEAALDGGSRSLVEMSSRLPEQTTVKTAARNGRVARGTMEYLVELPKKM